jgi:hypothetical protein
MKSNVDVTILRKPSSTPNQYETPDFNLASYISWGKMVLVDTKVEVKY